MATKQEIVNETDIFVKEVRQMQKIAKQIDDNWKITRVYDKFPPKPLDMDLLAYFQLKCDFLTAKENAFTWWTSNVMEVLEKSIRSKYLIRGGFMRLIRMNQCFTYKRDGQLSDWELLNKFNPYLISSKIAMFEEQIESMYTLNISHSESTIHGFVSVSYPLEKLAIWIIEQKDALARYRKKSSHHMQLLKQVMATYSPKEQQQIKRYMRSQGSYRPAEVIGRLQVDLYQVINKERAERNRQRENARQRAINNHVAMIKLSRQVTTA